MRKRALFWEQCIIVQIWNIQKKECVYFKREREREKDDIRSVVFVSSHVHFLHAN